MNNHTVAYAQLDTQEKLLVDNAIANRGKNPVIAWLLWFFLGLLGAHRFYFGKIGTGILMILLTFCFGIGTIWWIIDAFRINSWIRQNHEEIEKDAIAQIVVGRNLKQTNN